ncbi:MAG TPA: GDP-mannose 4,6-dehydratase, partial [bacterium]|nr:GDP-mannose 4,6-dehydratase [bacterium]
NNFGPYQYPEKLIPLFVTNALQEESLPLYGDGTNVRDWLYVEDHCDAIRFLIEHGQEGEAYNIAAGNEMQNIEITRMILSVLDKDESSIQFVTDRKAHDRRYALDTTKIHALGWTPAHRGTAGFKQALRETIHWYVANESWWKPLKKGDFLDYYKRRYQLELSNQESEDQD